MRRATAGTTRSVRTTAEHPRPVSNTKGRAHPTRRRQGASDRQSPTRSSRGARAEREGSAATDLATSERRAALGGPRRSANRATPSASRGVRRERLAYAATKVRLAPYLRRDSGAMHTARPSDRRSGSGAQPQQRRARNELRSRWPRDAAGPTNSRSKPANDRVIGYDEPACASERSTRGERPNQSRPSIPSRLGGRSGPMLRASERCGE